MIVYPKKAQLTKIKLFFKKKKLGEFNKAKPLKKVNEMIGANYFKKLPPDIHDLYNLYQIITLNKRTTIWEIGCGYSSLIIIIALNDLKKKFFNKTLKLRRNNPYELFILDNENKYLNSTKNLIKNYFRKSKQKNNVKIHYLKSNLNMTKFNGQICTEYSKLPMCNPDFIYLDGPGQFSVRNNVNGFSTRHIDLMPMSCDILKIENFLIPGTILLSDGRAANVRFLINNLKRNWVYKKFQHVDQHVLYLKEISLGKINSDLLKFYKL